MGPQFPKPRQIGYEREVHTLIPKLWGYPLSFPSEGPLKPEATSPATPSPARPAWLFVRCCTAGPRVEPAELVAGPA